MHFESASYTGNAIGHGDKLCLLTIDRL
jgi:hypothetical protein